MWHRFLCMRGASPGAMSLPGPVSERSRIVCMAKRLTVTHVLRDLSGCGDANANVPKLAELLYRSVYLLGIRSLWIQYRLRVVED